jgi:hypothetical protein
MTSLPPHTFETRVMNPRFRIHFQHQKPIGSHQARFWHKTSMEKGIVSYSGIDTDARWGKSRTKGWVFGYTYVTGEAGSSPTATACGE